MTDYLDEIQARVDAVTPGPWAFAYSSSDMAAIALAIVRTDVPRLVAALRTVEALCAEADAAHEKYLAGVILDRFIVPANVTTERIRTAIRDALGEA